MIYVIGLDVSMNSTGWAVIGVEADRLHLIDSGVIKANDKLPYGKRLRNQRTKFQEIIEKYPTKYVAREAGFQRHIKATQVLFRAYGVTEEFFADIDLVEYASGTIKKIVTGNGKATKEEVEKAIRETLNLPKTFKFTTNDESDAVGIAITHIKKLKIQKGV
ncbi:crossover junction endodeoxyribonuclease RuvC [Terrihalobacillus insolitus]|uniref:crossover junction endodeoxyribonuclease RuvC n=1 Tax=Terrihalobacillus insolitus TaxID=2950438 RepID=UPI0023400E2B|nr:crossover junction endodeoxyribonuclease RuvC [Terrihalobacillus insolitus]MDC3413937.1 crossover junction endodeoxyribonuclease RuvC [Terrihalobacillus insolitus]